jgi:hypothetical protein
MRCAVLTMILVLTAGGCGTVENYTGAENAALADQSRLGCARITLRDAATGQPIVGCCYIGLKFSTDEAAVDRRLPIMVDGPKRPGSPGGSHEFKLSPGWYRLELSAEGYANAWTPKFQIVEGKTTSLTTEMKKQAP